MGSKAQKYPWARWLLLFGASLTLLLGSFALHAYRAAIPAAEENLRGLALSLTTTIESLATQDPSLALLQNIQSRDIAYFAVIDRSGRQRYHSNPELINTPAAVDRYRTALDTQHFQEARVTLGTGEVAYEFTAPLHLPTATHALQLVLHTYRADTLVHRAELGALALGVLLLAAWVLGVVLYRFARRADRHRREMAEQEHLARLGTLGAVLAHEVRNPLAGIKGYAQLLEEQLPDPENRLFAERIVAESIRLEALVNDLLSYARSDAPRCATLQLAALVDQVVDLVRQEAADRDIAIACEGLARISLVTDRNRLEQVLLNLLKNALQAMPEGGNITIRGERQGKQVLLTVADSGVGIAGEDLERIFEPFFTRRARGSGIGLAVSRKYVAELGGTLTVQSEPGKGSRFLIALPVGTPATEG